jgi:hypothetical protein
MPPAPVAAGAPLALPGLRLRLLIGSEMLPGWLSRLDRRLQRTDR